MATSKTSHLPFIHRFFETSYNQKYLKLGSAENYNDQFFDSNTGTQHELGLCKNWGNHAGLSERIFLF